MIVECGKFTNRCRAIRPCCHRNLLEILDFIHPLLTKHKIPHWLNFGTLLGAVRDQNLIPWDEDIDIGVWEEDVPRILKLEKIILSGGFRVLVNRIGNGRVCSLAIFYSHVNSLHIGVNTWTVQGDEACGIEWSGMRFPLSKLTTLSTATIGAKKYPCPSDPEIGLEGFYGPDWKVPKIKKWIKNLGDGYWDPKTAELIDSLEEYEYEPGRKRGPA